MATDYSKMTNEQIANAVKLGDYEGLGLLIKNLMPHIKAAALKWKSVVNDTDDLVGEGITAVFKAVKSFDESKASFITFAKLCIDRAIGNRVRSELSAKRIPESMIVSFENDNISCESAEDLVIKKEEENTFKQSVAENLSNLERDVLKLHLEGQAYQEIANNLGITVKSVDGALQRIRNKLKKMP
ncbi:MAG: sigma-70 family RNA polymerase sigma factor [Clostridia bacterium]|nr:sigma-70 family RNA polymerase sigma factor [Clostridia bacterium]